MQRKGRWVRAHLYDTIEADLIGGEGFLSRGPDIDGFEARFGINCGFGFEEFEVDRIDNFSSLFVRINGNDPIVRDPVLPEEVQETDEGAL